MKLLLCYPPVSDQYEKIRDSGLAPHLSLLCLASQARFKFKGIKIKIIDGHHFDSKKIKELIDEFKPDLAGFSVDFTNYQSAIGLSKYCKRFKIKVLLGSNHASNLYEQILANQPSVDAIVCNDGEDGLVGYINHLLGKMSLGQVPNLAYRQDGKVVRNALKTFDLKLMKEPAYDLCDMEEYFKRQQKVFGKNFRMLQFTSQRGCVNFPLCVFCGRYPDGYRLRPARIVAREVLKYIKRYNLNEVWDRSDSFIQSLSWLKEFRDEIYSQKYNPFKDKTVTFKTYARGDQLLKPEVIELLKDLNFRIVFIGYEAGDDRILKNIGKNSKVESYYQATKNVLDAGMQIDASFIVGLPGENKASLANHIKFVKKLVKMGLRKIRVNRLLVLPGTPLYRKVLEKYPQLRDKDIYDMQEIQEKLFTTDYYNLKDFGGSVKKFKLALNDTAEEMTHLVTVAGGGAEGYGHGKSKMILSGSEYEKK
ncbi:MAG: radical SAM protein [Patescibacteria group bacterium]